VWHGLVASEHAHDRIDVAIDDGEALLRVAERE
jgi:hypothetical protein